MTMTPERGSHGSFSSLRLPGAAAATSVSVIVPTYCEVENLEELVARLGRVRENALPDLELIIVDDDSRDGIEQAIEALALPWVRLLVRRNVRGLGTAVLAGFADARGDVLVAMDADLSHPPERIPELVARLSDGPEFVLGSRYVAGASTDAHWSVWRWINSRTATLLARPLTAVRDPMSGFFALRRTTLDAAAPLNPVGYKIGLELLVKCRCRNVAEVPIAFVERRRGRSKLTIRQQGLYLRHVLRLLKFKCFG